MTRAGDAGVTLVEMLVSLVLFALIGGAGFAVLDQVLRVQRQTEAVLADLGEMQRAMHLLAVDAALAQPGSLTVTPGTVGLSRSLSMGAVEVRYGLEDGVLVRVLGGEVRQPVLGGVAEVRWEGLGPGGTWQPLDRLTDAAPRAIAVTLRLMRGDRTLRRVLPLLAAVPP